MSRPQGTLVLYRFFDADDTLLYVGITNSPFSRFNSHRTDKSWFKHVAYSKMEHFKSRDELEAAEIRAIQTEKPKYNVQHSVVSPPNSIKVKPRAVSCRSADANRFKRPDAIACADPAEDELEDRLDDIESTDPKSQGALVPRCPCPDCDLIILVIQDDGLIKCLNCLNMWALEELPERQMYWVEQMANSLAADELKGESAA